MISACLPFLASIFGHRMLEVFRVLSRIGSKTLSRLGIRRGPIDQTKDAPDPRTHRASYEEIELADGKNNPIPAAMKNDSGGSFPSVQGFV